MHEINSGVGRLQVPWSAHRNETAALTPETWAKIDLDAIRNNLRTIRRMSGNARVYVVCKGHGYGFDAVTVAQLAADEKMDALACGDPADVLRIRQANIELPILLYGATCAAQLPEVAKLGVCVTAHDVASLTACLENNLQFSIKFDTGFSRLGFREESLGELEIAVRNYPHAHAIGAYTHLSETDDPRAVVRQVDLFKRMVSRIETAGWAELERMVASSRVLIRHPDLAMDAVNPGRLVYGVLEPPYDHTPGIRSALSEVKTRVIALKKVKAGAVLGYSRGALERDTTIAVIPFGFAHGYPRMPAGGKVLVGGQRVNFLGPRHTEHSILDVTDVNDVKLGDEVVVIGTQGNVTIGPNEVSDMTGVPLIELVARLASACPSQH